jgi:hypothetical protein
MWNVCTIKGWVMEIALVTQEVTLGRMAKASLCKNALISGADRGPSGRRPNIHQTSHDARAKQNTVIGRQNRGMRLRVTDISLIGVATSY